MLGRLILLLLQIAIGWFGTNALMGHIPVGGPFELFVFAIVAAIVVFLIGVIAAQVMKEIGTPSSHTLSWALALRSSPLLLWSFGPQLPHSLRGAVGQDPGEYAVLAGAILGYSMRR